MGDAAGKPDKRWRGKPPARLAQTGRASRGGPGSLLWRFAARLVVWFRSSWLSALAFASAFQRTGGSMDFLIPAFAYSLRLSPVEDAVNRSDPLQPQIDAEMARRLSLPSAASTDVKR